MITKILKFKWYIIGFILILIIFITFFMNNINNNEIINIENDIKEDTYVEESTKYYADIVGEIVHPGVYEINENMRIIDLITIAGGLTNNADISLLNLSKKVTDEGYIKIYSKEEVKRTKENLKEDDNPIIIIQEIEKECVCPEVNNIACINEFEDNSNIDNTNEEDTINENNNKLININTATLEELTTIPGIGESKALKIIEYRNTTLFTKIEDILNVSGIGESIFEKIKTHITV